jgi:hypothetical protein
MYSEAPRRLYENLGRPDPVDIVLILADPPPPPPADMKAIGPSVVLRRLVAVRVGRVEVAKGYRM